MLVILKDGTVPPLPVGGICYEHRTRFILRMDHIGIYGRYGIGAYTGRTVRVCPGYGVAAVVPCLHPDMPRHVRTACRRHEKIRLPLRQVEFRHPAIALAGQGAIPAESGIQFHVLQAGRAFRYRSPDIAVPVTEVEIEPARNPRLRHFPGHVRHRHKTIRRFLVIYAERGAGIEVFRLQRTRKVFRE